MCDCLVHCKGDGILRRSPNWLGMRVGEMNAVENERSDGWDSGYDGFREIGQGLARKVHDRHLTDVRKELYCRRGVRSIPLGRETVKANDHPVSDLLRRHNANTARHECYLWVLLHDSLNSSEAGSGYAITAER